MRLLQRQQLNGIARLLPPIGHRHHLHTPSSHAVQPAKPNAERKMGAWQVHAYGDVREELQFSDRVKVPVLSDANDVLVRVSASSLNAIDVEMASKRPPI